MRLLWLYRSETSPQLEWRQAGLPSPRLVHLKHGLTLLGVLELFMKIQISRAWLNSRATKVQVEKLSTRNSPQTHVAC